MAARPATTRRRVAVAFLATGTVFATTALVLLPSAGASSHREAPLILGEPQLDNTDVYAFTSPDRPDTVTLISNWQGFQEPNGGPNFYPWEEGAHYDINIDSDGDAVPDITYRWVFETQDLRGENNTFLYNNGPVTSLDDENLLFRQTYDLIEIDGEGNVETLLSDVPAAPSNTGPASFPDYGALVDEASIGLPEGGQSYAGQADESFFLDLRVFDLLYGGDLSEVGNDTFAGFNINTIALQVPKSELALNNDVETNPVIGVWSETDKPSMDLLPDQAGGPGQDPPGLGLLPDEAEQGQGPGGQHAQVSRLGNPLVNEVIPTAAMKDAFNASQPVDDAGNEELLARIKDPEVPRLIEQIYGIPAPETPRNDLVEIFLTGITDKSGDEINVGPLNSQLDNGDVNPDEFQPSEQLRLNMSIPVSENPNRLGVLAGDLQGFPNGRRLGDDVLDIELQALEGAVRTGELVEPLAAGDAVDANDKPFSDHFPYIAVANNESVNNQDGAAAVPPAGWPGAPWLTTPVVTGLAALSLLGTGAWLLRRRPDLTPGRGNAIPAFE